MTTPTLSRGDVVLTRFPFTDLTGASHRPAAVVSRGQIGKDVVLVAISSVLRGAVAPTDYTVDVTHPEFALTGLRVTSVLRMHKLAAVERSVIIRRPWASGAATADGGGQAAPNGTGIVGARKAGRQLPNA